LNGRVDESMRALVDVAIRRPEKGGGRVLFRSALGRA